jgi:hypothetical protein
MLKTNDGFLVCPSGGKHERMIPLFGDVWYPLVNIQETIEHGPLK